jgi:dTDP-4-amino-4,6-dideoxygalactose transaminase
MRETHFLQRKHVFLKYTSIQAAIGKLQLTKLADFNEQRIKNAERIIDEVEHLEWFSFQKSHKLAKPVFLRLVVKYNRKRNARDRLMKEFVKHGFDVPVLNDYYLLPYLRYGKYPPSIHKIFARIKHDVVDKLLALPTNPSLSDQDINCLVSVLKDAQYLS